ncbi:NAD-dependent epimerase/dehydratase family protein [Natronomonas salina]|uniref:NAD-dependent epimerase/dehydratase family protein n=1 Tax=Natronomonas salina TaxID=1710540 RepID=UPI0015B3B5FA|nr:NAD-dependent epimerase/dehydratase family protein [Natronomonas salina]QLD88775.1 NAD-dependent epimerase/dehydratase family protein [Natronomonas salina]
MFEQREILITGGAGFIGSHLATAFKEDNRVTILDNSITPNQFIPDDVEVIESDVRDAETVDAAVEATDVVFHQAALVSVSGSIQNPKQSHSINATGTLNILEAARKYDSRVVVASSAAVYGQPDVTPIPESHPLEPASPYGLNKLTSDHYARLYNDLYGLETVALRYFNVYGTGQKGGDYTGVIEVFLEQAQDGGPITVHGDGQQTRDFVHVHDVVDANRLAAETDAVGKAFNIGTGSAITIRDLAELIKNTGDSSAEIVHKDPREGDIRHSCADISLARKQLGYSPERSIEEELGTFL